MDQRAELTRLRRDNQRLAQDLAAAQAANFTLRQRIGPLEADNRALRLQNAELQQQLQQLHMQALAQQAQLHDLQQRLDALDLPGSTAQPQPPAWVKPNKPRTDRPPRQKRKPEHNKARPRDPNPTRVEQHALEECPDCGQHLSGGRLARCRQVIELPPPQPIEVTEHQVFKRWCGRCRRWQLPKLELTEQVVGQGRIGVRLASLIAGLRHVARLPLAIIQRLLEHLYGLHLSVGGLAELLQRLAKAIASAFAKLLETARGSPVLHMDESGWREEGDNGYIWELATEGPTGVRIFVYEHSRGGAVLDQLLEGAFSGVLVSDFYAAYNSYAGTHQRCWVHLLRDLHELKKAHPLDGSVAAWAAAVKKLYAAGKAFSAQQPAPSERERLRKYGQLRGRLRELGQQYEGQAGHPCQTLAKRLLRHIEEMFIYVRQAGVPADNNLAERGLRPLVVSRKISGGSRSADGSVTHMRLASLIATFMARGQNPFSELQKLLAGKTDPQTALPQV